MGVEPFLITASVNLVLAQRLARKICVDCKQPFIVDANALKDIGFTEEQVAKSKLMGSRRGNNAKPIRFANP